MSQFIDIDSLNKHACGLTFDEEIVCWGNKDYGQLDVPPI